MGPLSVVEVYPLADDLLGPLSNEADPFGQGADGVALAANRLGLEDSPEDARCLLTPTSIINFLKRCLRVAPPLVTVHSGPVLQRIGQASADAGWHRTIGQ